MHVNLDKVYKDYETNQDLEKIIDNMLLVKILKKEQDEKNIFEKPEKIVKYAINNQIWNYKFIYSNFIYNGYIKLCNFFHGIF